MMSKIQPQTLNASEACLYLGIGRTQFYELYNAGAIAAILFSRRSRPRFLITDLDSFIRSRRRIKESQKLSVHKIPSFITKDPKLQKRLDKYK